MNINSFPLSDPMIQRIAWTLIHFVWQGLAIAFLLVAAVRIGQVRRSSWRYVCSLSALVVMVAMPVITFLLLSPGPNTVSSDSFIKQGPTAQELLPTRTMQVTPAAVSVPADRTDLSTKVIESVPLPANASDVLTPSTSHQQSVQNPLLWKWVQPSIVVGWFAGVALLSLRLLIGWLGILRLRRQIDDGPGRLVDRMNHLADQLHMSVPLLRVGHRVTEAIAVGFVKPMILLPMAWVTEMPPDMLDAVLAHELAHIRRHDLWIILFQRLVETLLFYHPAVWWLSRRLRMEREMCCDELVVQVTQNPLRYAETLEHIGRLSVASQRATLAVSIASPRSLLVERVRNILRLRPHEQSSWAWLVALIPLMLVGFTCWTAFPIRETSLLAEENAKPVSEKPNVGPGESANNESKITLKGKVLDDRGKPVADADVIMFQKADVNTDAPPVKVLATKTDQHGVFQLKGSPRLFQSAVVWSVVPWEQTWTGPGLGWGIHLAHTYDTPVAADGTPIFEIPKDSPDRFVIRLNRKPGRIRVEDPQLKPVAGAKVVVTALTPPRSDLAKHVELESELRLGARFPRYNFSEWIHVPVEFRGMLTGSTGPDGTVALEGVEPNRIAGLRVETESHGLQMVPRDYSNLGNQELYRFRLSPVGRVEGKVVAEPRAHSAGFRTEGMKLTFRTSNLRSPLADEWAIDNKEVIVRGDVIEVSISDDLGEMEPVTLPVRVNDQGIANLPEIGSVALVGLETKAAETKIAAACIDRKLFPRAKVTVTMKRQQMNRATDGWATAIVDAAGNFSVPMIAHGFIELESPLPKDSLYFLSSPLNARVPAGQSLKLSLSVNKKVKAQGVVRKRGSDETVSTTVMITQFHGSGFRNPHSQRAKTDEKGFYEALVHPGLIEMRPHSPIDGWATVFAWEHEHPRSALALHHEVADSDDVARLPSVDLVPTHPLTGKLVDQQGDPVEAKWEIVGFPSKDGPSCARGVTRDGGEFKLIVPSSYPPMRFMAQRKTQPFQNFDDHRVYNIKYGVNVISKEPLVLQLPGTPKQAPPIVGDRKDSLPKQTPTELGAARKKRLAGNDAVAGKTLVGDWKLKLPKGFVYSITLKQREDGCLILTSEKELVTAGVFTFKDRRLELLEAKRPEVDDFVWEQQPDGSLKLIHEQHRHGADYIGAVLEPVTAKVAPDDSGLAIISLRMARGRTNDRAAATKLVGRWMLTLPTDEVFDVQITQTENGCLDLASKKKVRLLGRYAVIGNRLEVVAPVDAGVIDFVWEVEDANRLKLARERHPFNEKYLGAKLERVVAAESNEADAKGKVFQIPASVIEQSRKLAAEWRQKRGDLKSRRPAGLSDLESPEGMRRAIDQSMAELADSQKQYDGLAKLQYLGDAAFDALAEGTKSANPQVAKWCCVVLLHHGKKAVPALSLAIKSHPDPGVRDAAISSLGQTFQPDGVPALIEALNDPDPSVRNSAMSSIKYPRDKRAIEPLKRLVNTPGSGHVAEGAIQHILHEQGYAWWPPETLPLWQLYQDSQTIKRETFGDAEYKALIDGLNSANPTLVYHCLFALGNMDARQAVPAIMQVAESQMKFHVLAEIATPEAFEYLVQRLHSLHQQTREVAILGLADGGDRWAAPLLIALLDDASLKVPEVKDPMGLNGNRANFSLNWPEWHRAHSALFMFFSRFELKGKWINLANGQPDGKVSEEITRLKAWWQKHGADFLAGKPVPSPELTTYFGSS